MDEQGDEGDEAGDFDEALTKTGEAVAPFLTTPRLILRAPAMADAPAIAEIANNRKVAEQTRRMPHPYGLRDAESWIEAANGAGEDAFLVARKSDKAVMGAAGVAAMDSGEKEIGYWIGEPYWGQGFATEAARAVIDRVFADDTVERLYGRCRVANAASRRVLLKCGFQLVGPAMCDSRVLSGLVPAEEFALERWVWASLKQWGAA